MEDKLVGILYQENINWVYSIIKELDSKGIERKEKFISDPYIFNNIIVLGYYFMNLYVISNIRDYSKEDAELILNSIIRGASSYNKKMLEKIYKEEIDLHKLVDQYNTLVRKTKMYAPNDGLKARVVAVDEIYRRIYDNVNKKHFKVFIKIFMSSFNQYEVIVNTAIDNYLRRG